MRSKNTTLGYKLTLALLTIFAATMLAGCKHDPKPDPQPNPDPQNPSKEDPKKTDNPNTAKDFKEWLKFDEAGNLATVPIPFADFSKGIEEVKAWEKEYGSTLYKESTNEGKTSLFYDTNDPKKLNVKRFYRFGGGKLEASIFSIASKLIFESTLAKAIPNDAFELILKKEGYTLTKEQPKRDGVSYTNGKYNIIFNYSTGNREITMAVVLPATKGGSDYSFQSDVKDLPLLLKGKYVKDYSETDVKAHEKNLGRVYSDKMSKSGERLVFLADGSTRTNLQKVVYDQKDGQNSDGSPRKAQIVATSLSIPNVEMLKTPEVKQYLQNQGFVYEKEVSFSGSSAFIYDAKDLGFKLTIASVDGKSTMWVFDKYAIKGGQDPNPQKIREAYYLPLYMWDAPITESSPIIAKEKERGMKVTFRPAETTGVLPRGAEINVEPPYDRDYGSSLKKLGISMISYSIDKYAKDPSKNVKAEWLLNYLNSKDKVEQGIKEAQAYLEEKGFVLKEGNGAANEVTCYYHEKDKVVAVISRMFGGCVVSFKYCETW